MESYSSQSWSPVRIPWTSCLYYMFICINLQPCVCSCVRVCVSVCMCVSLCVYLHVCICVWVGCDVALPGSYASISGVMLSVLGSSKTKTLPQPLPLRPDRYTLHLTGNWRAGVMTYFNHLGRHNILQMYGYCYGFSSGLVLVESNFCPG